jgi:outer membrane protein W
MPSKVKKSLLCAGIALGIGVDASPGKVKIDPCVYDAQISYRF